METTQTTPTGDGCSPFDQLPATVASSAAVVFLNRPGADFGYFNQAPKRADWPEEIRLKVGGAEKSFPCTYLDRDMIEEGEYVHPTTGKAIKASREQINQWADTYKKMADAGIELYIPCDHAKGARSNLGFVKDAKVVEGPGGKARLKLTHQFIGEDAPLVALRNRGSLGIDPDYVDAKGKRWGSAIIHSAVTPDPVIFGMGAFTPTQLSRKEGEATPETPVYFFRDSTETPSAPAEPAAAEAPSQAAVQPEGDTAPRSNDMDPAIRERLLARTGLPAETTDEVLLARAADELDAQRDDIQELSRITTEQEQAIELSRTQLEEAETKATEQINLSRDQIASQSGREILMSREGAGVMAERWMRLNEKCERLAKQGWTPAAIARIKHSTIGTQDRVNVFNLSRETDEAPCAADSILDVLLEYKPNDPGTGEANLQELSRLDPRNQNGQQQGKDEPRINPFTGKPVGAVEAELTKQSA
nr:hypothetical protein [uncultured Rhodopila sp.]